MPSRAALLDNILDDFFQTPVIVLVTRDPWGFPDMQMPRVAKDMARQVFVGVEAFIYGHVEPTKHNGDKA